MRGRRRPWWRIVLFAFAVGPVAALAAAIVLFDPNEYKSHVIHAVEQATGRALILNGPVSLTRSLWPTLEVADVMLGNLPGGSRPDMARVERIEAKLSLPAMLQRRIEITTLTLVGPNILIEEVAGKPNWTFHGEAPPSPAAAQPPGYPLELRIRQVHVQNGMVTFRLPARTRVVGIRSLDLRYPADSAPLDLAAILVYSDFAPFTLAATVQPLGGVDGPWRAQFRLAAFDTGLSAVGTIRLTGQFDLQVDAKTGALEKLNALLPEMDLPALHGAMLSTHITNGSVLGGFPSIGKTRLQFQSANLEDRVAGLHMGTTEIFVPDGGGTATLAGEGRISGQPFKIAGTVGVPEHPGGRANVPIDVTAEALPTESKSARSTVGTLALQGKLRLDKLRFAGLEAAAELRTPALAALRQIVRHRLPPLTDVHFHGRLVIPADVKSVSFKGATLAMAGGDIGGDGAIALSPPTLKGNLHAARLDADAMAKVLGVALPPGSPNPAGPVISDSPLPWAMLREQNLDVVASVDALTLAGQVWQKVDIGLHLQDGIMKLARAKLALPAGPLELRMTADASQQAVPVSLALTAPGLPLGLIAHYAGLPGPATGSVRVDARLQAAGRSLHGLAATLDGPFSISAVGGRLGNQALIALAAPALDALGIKVPAQGETVLHCLGLAGSFKNGVGSLKTVALETTYLQLEGVGQVDLARETLALKLQPLAQVAGSPVSVPVVVEGLLRSPNGRLDASGLDKLGFLLDAWFGGDKPQACAHAGLVPH